MLKSEISEDVVEYRIYPPLDGATDAVINSDEMLAEALALSQGYIWHCDGFNLMEKSIPVRHFYGRTQYAENLDDEWFLTWILVQLSQKFPSLVIQAVDFDGDFLLMEAADFLPDWLTPSTSKNRVFIQGGHVHLLTPEESTGDIAEIASPHIGAQMVRDRDPKDVNSDINGAIERRLSSYPQSIRDNWHRCRLLLPAKLALIVHEKPHLIGPATRAFYLRDFDDIKACRELRRFGVANGDRKQLCSERVIFTKHQYAMLAKQQYEADRHSSNWPPATILEKNDCNAADIGLKLTCGFEILCAKNSNKGAGNDSLSGAPSPTLDYERLEQFIAKLKTVGYFQSEEYGSKKYEELLSQARSYYEDNVHQQGGLKKNPGQEIANCFAMKMSNVLAKKIAAEHQSLENEKEDDDDSWLNVVAADLAIDGALTSEEQARASVLVGSVGDFLEKQSAPFDGIGDSNDRQKKSEQKSSHLNVNPSELVGSLSKFLDLDNHINRNTNKYESSESDSYGEEDLELDMYEAKEMSSNLRDYMRAMDEELAGHKSLSGGFVNKTPLLTTESQQTASSSSTRIKSKSPGADSIDLADDEFSPVDVDKNLVENMLKSYLTEQKSPSIGSTTGGTGPATSLLQGIKLQRGNAAAAISGKGEFDDDDIKFAEDLDSDDDPN